MNFNLSFFQKAKTGHVEIGESAEIWIKNSVIKGYHVYEIRPPTVAMSTNRLMVDLEYINIVDPHVSLVWVPEISTFPNELHEITTDAKRHLQLKDIAGLPIGHAPRGLGFVFRQLIERGCRVEAIALGDPCPSFPPWPPVMEKGGGVVIPCDYIISSVSKDYLNEAKELIISTLSNMPEREAMAVDIVFT